MTSSNWRRNWLAVAALTISASAGAAPVEGDYVEGEALVRFQSANVPEEARQVAARHGLTLARHFGWMSKQAGRVIGLVRSESLTTEALLAELRTDPAIAFAEPNFLRHVADLHTPNDAKFKLLYGLRNTGQEVNGFYGTAHDDIGFLQAWGLARPATNEIVVGVIDTGVDPTHPDLVNNLWTNPREIPGNGADDDGNGYVDDIHGYDFSLGTGTLTDSSDHGTHVAGTIAASGNNGIGVIGVDFQAHLMILKASSNGSNITTAAIIEAVQYATMMKTRGVNIVALNASFGGGNSSSNEASAIAAAGSAGIILCAAAGNNTNNNDSIHIYPASYRLTNMIVVAASDQNDALANFSDYGANSVDLAAPGVNILSCMPTSQPGYNSYVQQSSNLFSANPLAYSGVTTAAGVAGAIYYCGLGYATNFPAAVSNNIALIERGTLYFSEKVTHAKAAGALAAVIYNNVAGNFNGTLQNPSNWIPAVTLSQTDGQALRNALPATGTVVNVLDPTQIYQFLDGTSMAAPHVSGAVAFAAMNFPAESVAQRRQRILANVTPVPALVGKAITGGRLNLARIVDTDGNGLPDWWELLHFGQLTGIDAKGDADGDGASNLAEFLAGTDPGDAHSALRLTVQPVAGGNNLILQWPSAAGRYYRLLRSTNLVSGFDTLLQTNISATPATNTYLDAAPSNSRSRFYRLQLEP